MRVTRTQVQFVLNILSSSCRLRFSSTQMTIEKERPR